MSKYENCHPSFSEDTLIYQAAEAAKGFYGLTDANQYFAGMCEHNADFVQLSNNVFRYKDYFIQVGKRFIMAGHGNALMGLAQKELSCLPQAIAVIWLDNNEDMVLVTRVKGSEGRRLLPYEGPVSALPVQARQRILADVDRLLEENSAISAVAEGKDWWNVIEGEGSIIFSRCEIAFVPDAAKAAYRSRVLKTLELDE